MRDMIHDEIISQCEKAQFIEAKKKQMIARVSSSTVY